VGKGLLLGALVMGCTSDFDATRKVPERGSLGRELYSLVCDRVGAQSLREDVTGSSFHAICHPDAAGQYATKVDVSKLVALDPNARDVSGKPVPLAKQEKARAYQVGRIEALGRRREDLVVAFDAAMPDITIAVKQLNAKDPTKSCDPAAEKAKLLAQLADTFSNFMGLYQDDTFPMVTRGLGRIMLDVKADAEVQAALARFDARQGYRPSSIAIGVARPAVAYPRLVELINALTRVVSSKGSGATEFQNMLRVLHEELRVPTETKPLGALTVTNDPILATRPVLSRPRSTLEISRLILLSQDDAFANGATPRFIVQRDTRGYAMVPLVGGALPAPFVDSTGDGLPDLDGLGQFVTKGTAAPSPFFAIGAPDGKRDVYGRALDPASAPLYAFIDTNRTFASALIRDLRPLFDPDPKHAHETVMSLLTGAPVVFGSRDGTPDTTRTYPPDPAQVEAYKLLHPGQPVPDKLVKDPVVLRYRGFHPEDSPIVDLVYALGQNMSDPAMDDALALFRKLLAERPNDVARLVGLGLRLKAIADKHPEAHIPANSTLWDEMLDVVAKMAEPGVKTPGLLDDLIRAFGKDDSLKLAPIFAAYIAYRDELTYDKKNLNGPAFNMTTGAVDPLKTPVDRTKPDTGNNRSALQRFMQVLHDANGLSACTKDGAIAHVDIKWSGIPVKLNYPTDALAKTVCVFLGETAPARLPQCGVLRLDNVAALLLDVALNRAKFEIRDPCLKKLSESALTDLVGGVDAFLEQTSGIKGFSTHPTVNGVARMVYYDTAHDGLPGDTTPETAKTHKFLMDVLDPVPSMVCPEAPFTDSDGKVVRLRKCASFKDTLRGRDDNALFPLEQMNFIASVGPLAAAFADHAQPLLFVDLFDTLHRHWGSTAQSKDECDPSLPKTDARWCTQDGGVTYEPLLVEMLQTDLFPVLHDFVQILQTTKIPHCDAFDPKTHVCTKSTDYDGVKVLAEATRVLVDPSRNVGLKDREGNQFATRNDGSKNPQTTPIYLLIDALEGIDAAFENDAAKGGPDRLTPWRTARSQIVDTFFAVDGTGPASQWHDPAIAKVLPVVLDTLRAQVFAHCPDRTVPCTWAREDLSATFSKVVGGPTFATTMDLLEVLRQDDLARTEVEKLLVYLLEKAPENDAETTTLAAATDLLQLLDDDTNLEPLYRIVAGAVEQSVVDDTGKARRRGLVDAMIEALSRIFALAHDGAGNEVCAKEIDPNRTIDTVLKRLLVPMGEGKQSPIEVIMGVIADVNRTDPSAVDAKLTGDDYANIATEIADFCLDDARGLEQVYEVIRQATKPVEP
jgi:hypothetical protein